MAGEDARRRAGGERQRGRGDRAAGRRGDRPLPRRSGSPRRRGDRGRAQGARLPTPPIPTVALTARGAGAVEALRAGVAEIVAKPFLLPPAHRHPAAALGRRRRPSGRRRRGGDRRPPAHPRGARAGRSDRPHRPAALAVRRGRDRQGDDRAARPRRERAARRTVRHRQPGRRPRDPRHCLVRSRATARLLDGCRAGWDDLPRGDRRAPAPGASAPSCTRCATGRSARSTVFRSRSTPALSPRPGAICASWSSPAASTRSSSELLSTAAIEMPPLRERREDIPALAEHFRRQVNAREARRVPGFALDLMHRLTQHDWPGQRARARVPLRAAGGHRRHADGGHEGPARNNSASR